MRKIEDISSFTNEIINQAKKEAETIIDRAKRAAEHDIRFAREDAEAIRDEYKDKTKNLAIQEERKVYTKVRQKARILLWQKKQELVSKAFDEAEKEIEKFRNSSRRQEDKSSIYNELTTGYRDSLIALAREGVEGIGDGNMKILVNPDDLEFFTDELLSEMSSSLVGVELEVCPEPKISAGAIVTKDFVLLNAKSESRSKHRARQVIFENSYTDRLERLRDELRGKVAELLLGEK